MKEMEQMRVLGLPNLPIIRINPEIKKHDNLPTFQKKTDEANELINRASVPKEFLKTQAESAANSEKRLCMRINYTIEQIQKYDAGIKQAILLNADPSLIEDWQMMKARYVTKLIKIMSEMDVDLELKTASFN